MFNNSILGVSEYTLFFTNSLNCEIIENRGLYSWGANHFSNISNLVLSENSLRNVYLKKVKNAELSGNIFSALEARYENEIFYLSYAFGVHDGQNITILDNIFSGSEYPVFISMCYEVWIIDNYFLNFDDFLLRIEHGDSVLEKISGSILNKIHVHHNCFYLSQYGISENFSLKFFYFFNSTIISSGYLILMIFSLAVIPLIVNISLIFRHKLNLIQFRINQVKEVINLENSDSWYFIYDNYGRLELYEKFRFKKVIYWLLITGSILYYFIIFSTFQNKTYPVLNTIQWILATLYLLAAIYSTIELRKIPKSITFNNPKHSKRLLGKTFGISILLNLVHFIVIQSIVNGLFSTYIIFYIIVIFTIFYIISSSLSNLDKKITKRMLIIIIVILIGFFILISSINNYGLFRRSYLLFLIFNRYIISELNFLMILLFLLIGIIGKKISSIGTDISEIGNQKEV
ncbi:hypothetical protein NEF87_004761 [Candidatus Lokiarchaeum ossiferum]|uniref:Periplasmic copper-binding protein NosD beta helix domain-containing protein n=1 Tax=Candidatus Lokiarchaeum ossiferum TaxID=2951803 RepID=A0ABY6HY66_9ARCH|nr:hypothetical protein NEF87_004761 [Candidatus Lokiarchaeum sp. B-35]